MSRPAFTRDDWTMFRNITTLAQRAGVELSDMSKVIVKELTDNALDAAGTCHVRLDSRTLTVKDDGEGIPGSDQQLAEIFSVRRGMISTKLLRLPSRGSLGNGARVIAGAALSTGGVIEISTRGRQLVLRPTDDGYTLIESRSDWSGVGTCIRMELREPLLIDKDTLSWAQEAIRLSINPSPYKRGTHPVWFDSDSFYELNQAAGALPVAELIKFFETRRESAVTKQAAQNGRICQSLSRTDTDELLALLRTKARRVTSESLGWVGPSPNLGARYARKLVHRDYQPARGVHSATIPYLIEVWAAVSEDDAPHVHLSINRTPITSPVSAQMQAKRFAVFGAGLSHFMTHGTLLVPDIHINITTPYVPMTNDGKSPSLLGLREDLGSLIGKTVNGLKIDRRTHQPSAGGSQKEIMLEAIPDAANKASGKGIYRYSQRQLYYIVRPIVMLALGIEPNYDHFTRVLTDWENQNGPLPGLYRDERGVLLHPHSREVISLGTLAVENYTRPPWNFSTILYTEKQGIIQILQDTDIPERYDVAVCTSKGMATRAVKDLLDLLDDQTENIVCLCLHDADSAGTMIYQTLVRATRTRAKRKVQVINIGLDPAEALDMGLQIEEITHKHKQPVADYVSEEWTTWLQKNRIELNAMTTSQLIAFLHDKLRLHAHPKVIPPSTVTNDAFQNATESRMREMLVQETLRSANIDSQVQHLLDNDKPLLERTAQTVHDDLPKLLTEHPQQSWRDVLEGTAADVAQRLVGKETNRSPYS